MKPRSSRFPIGTFLIKILRDSGLTISPFVLAIGYRNSSKGVRAFDQTLKCGVVNKVFLQRLASSPLAPDPYELSQAIEESLEIVQRERHEMLLAEKEAERQSFRPFVQGVPELKVPSPIFAFCLTGGHSSYTLSLPDESLTWTEHEQHRYVKELITRHYAGCKGRTHFMGPIIGYRLFLRYDEWPFAYTIEGEPVGQTDAYPLPAGMLKVSGRKKNFYL